MTKKDLKHYMSLDYPYELSDWESGFFSVHPDLPGSTSQGMGLLPCPCCGTPDPRCGPSSGNGSAISCRGCGLFLVRSADCSETELAATEAWNQRVDVSIPADDKLTVQVIIQKLESEEIAVWAQGENSLIEQGKRIALRGILSWIKQQQRLQETPA